MHRNLKRISYTPSYSSWLRKTSILWFIVVLQAAKCLSGREQEQKPLNGSKVNSNSSVQEKPANCKQSDSDASKTLDSDPSETNDDLIEEVELEGQLAKSNGLLGKLKGMPKQLAKLKEKFRIKFNYKKAANKKEEVDKTPENEVICLLCWAIQENDVSLVELLLDRKSNDSAVDKAGTMLWILYYALLYGDKPKEIVNLILKISPFSR